MQLVGKELAATNVRHETLLGIHKDHNSLCCLISDSNELDTILLTIDEGAARVRRTLKEVADQCLLHYTTHSR